MVHSTHPISCVSFHSLAQPSIPSCGKQPPIHKDKGCPHSKSETRLFSLFIPSPSPSALCILSCSVEQEELRILEMLVRSKRKLTPKQEDRKKALEAERKKKLQSSAYTDELERR
jgi:hypothetical protein